MTAFAHGSMYSPSRFRLNLVLWVSRRHRPFSVIEDPELIELFRSLNVNVPIPSRTTLSRDVKEVFQISRTKLISILQVRVQFLVSMTPHPSAGISTQATPVH
jgi:hypothetical protein